MKSLLFILLTTLLVCNSISQNQNIKSENHHEFSKTVPITPKIIWVDTTVEYCKYYWSDIQSSWYISSKTTNTYDTSGNLIEDIYLISGGIMQGPWDRNTYTYDLNGNIKEQINYNWDDLDSSWYYSWQEAYSYGVNGNLSELLFYYWDNSSSSWIIDSKDTSIYDTIGNLTEIIYYFWESSTSSWAVYAKQTCTIDSNGNQTERLIYNWNDNTSSWDNYYKYSHSYDTNGNVILDSYYEWNDSSNSWDNSMRDHTYTYDVNGILKEETSYIYSDASNSWLWIKNTYTYNGNGNLNNDIAFLWNDVTSSWDNYYKNTLCNIITFVEESTTKSISIYPNPTNTSITIDNIETGNLIHIYNGLGQFVHEYRVNSSSMTIDLKQYSKGLYIIIVANSNKPFTSRLIVE